MSKAVIKGSSSRRDYLGFHPGVEPFYKYKSFNYPMSVIKMILSDPDFPYLELYLATCPVVLRHGNAL